MSAFEALRGLKNKVPWLRDAGPAQEQVPEPQPSTAERFAELVRMASTEARIERGSATWIAVCRWAATELLETYSRQDTADDTKTAALRERARVLRELLELKDQSETVVIFEDASPHIP